MQSNFGWSICPDLGKIYASLLSIYKSGDLHPLRYGSGEPNELWAFYCGEGVASGVPYACLQSFSAIRRQGLLPLNFLGRIEL